MLLQGQLRQEISKGRGYDGGYVHLDLTHLGADRIKERLPGNTADSYGFCRC